ncbi:MAG TPA: hypothetical protein VF618_06250 [Thermoanaerobaculia bacterium]
MITRRLAALVLLLVCIACKPSSQPQQQGKPAAAGPRTRATIVTVRTVLEPSKRTIDHELTISGGRARSSSESETWRLYDLEKKTVTFVDDVEQTSRTETFDSLVAKRRAALSQPLRGDVPRAKLETTKEQKTLQGVAATKSVVRVGNYTRELWIGKHPQIPPELFAMMLASETPSSPLAPMMREADEKLVEVEGFPLLDRAELPFGNQKMIVEKSVVSVAQREVPEAALQVPREYKDVTPRPKAPAAKANQSRR